MAKQEFKNVKLVARHLPEDHYEVDANGVRQQTELPGFVEVGVELDGAYFGLGRFHGSDVLEKIEAAKAAGSAEKPS